MPRSFALSPLLLLLPLSAGILPAAAAEGPAGRVKARSSREIEAEIERLGRAKPDWWDSVSLEYPKSLDLSYPHPPKGGWNNQKNLGQYIWDVINPNPGKWKQGVRLMHHVLTVNQDRPEVRQRVMADLGRMYWNLLQDYPRAAFWWRAAGVDKQRGGEAVHLAECYWRLGSKPMALELLAKLPPQFSMIKLWGDMGELDRALKLADASLHGPAADLACLYAGDACRVAGRHQQAMAYYQKMLGVPAAGQARNRIVRNQERARADLEAIRLFDTLDLARVPDGTYRAGSLGYEAPVVVEVSVRSHRIESVRVAEHHEKQFYTAMTDTPRKILAKQSVREIDATSSATLTSVAIVNATAKALAGASKQALPMRAPSLRRTTQAGCLAVFLVLFCYAAWPYTARPAAPGGAWPSHYADDLAAKQRCLPAEFFLQMDPLVGLAAAIAARAWIGALAVGGAVWAIGLLSPRWFCAFVCPLGTLLDLFDTLARRRGIPASLVQRRLPPPGATGGVSARDARSRSGGTPLAPVLPAKRRSTEPRIRGLRSKTTTRHRHPMPWPVRNLKYVLLATTLAAAAAGVLVAGYAAAIPVVTRGLAFTLAPLQTGWARGWHQVPPWNLGQGLSLGLLAAIFGLGLVRPRFWCRYLCPTGALFSLGSLLRLRHRQVTPSCTACGKCARACPFDAVQAESDFASRPADCAHCGTCQAACPADAIRYVGRWSSGAKPAADAESPPSPAESQGHGRLSRRGMMAAGVGTATALGLTSAVVLKSLRPRPGETTCVPPIRPPGSVPEEEFLALCIRCGECYRACPNDALQPIGLSLGPDALWTPQVRPSWSGCEASCNRCGQVCPTGAIRPLPLDEKRAARIGLAVVDRETCLPWARSGDCRLCVDECAAAGYRAVEFLRVGTEVDSLGQPVPDSGFLAPVVLAEKCVGCGLCQTRCEAVHVRQSGRLKETAIRVAAGPGNEDRLRTGSYRELRAAQQRRHKPASSDDSYLPDFLK